MKSKKSRQKAQLSLEFLLVISAFFAVLALFVPLLNHLQELGVYSLDVRNAESFAFSMQAKIDAMLLLGDGSSMPISAKPLRRWVLSSREKSLLVTVENTYLDSHKTFEVEFPNKIFLNRTVLGEETVFVIRKQESKVLLENL